MKIIRVLVVCAIIAVVAIGYRLITVVSTDTGESNKEAIQLDEKGNLQLSEEDKQEVNDYLTKKGINTDNLEAGNDTSEQEDVAKDDTDEPSGSEDSKYVPGPDEGDKPTDLIDKKAVEEIDKEGWHYDKDGDYVNRITDEVNNAEIEESDITDD